ncbi:hypothetical protein HN836_03515 [Candidatus Woesearchaeota archaeon]|nr:hypothetical protein [Candidatus Woesearchaeota archaeon]
MFGSPFSFLSLNTLRDYSLSQDISSQGILFFDSFNLLITNIKEQIFPITGIFFLIYLIVLFYSIKNKEYNIIPLLSIPIIQLFFYFGGIWGGYGQELVSYSAYQRYFLISYSILFLSFGIFVNNIRFKKQLVSILTFLAITFLVISFPFLINDINRFDDTIEKTIDYKKQLITNTEKNAIIFTKIQDKNIFPERTPAIYQSIPPEHRIEETTEIIEKLLLNGYHVYFLKEDNVRMSDMEFLFEEYKKDLEKNNFRLINKFNNFYEITKNEN